MNTVSRSEALKRAEAAMKKAGFGGLGRIAGRECIADAIVKAAEDGQQYGRLEAAARCAAIAEVHQDETLAEVPHKKQGECEHLECCEQRSMSKTASLIARDIRAFFKLTEKA